MSEKTDVFEELLKWRDLYFKDLEIKNLSQNTLKTYNRALDEFFEFLVEEQNGENGLEMLKWEDLNIFTIKHFLANLKNRLSPRSLNLYLRVIKNFFKFISESNEEGIDPYYRIEKIKPIKEPKTEIVTFEENELEKIDRALFRTLDKTKSYSKFKNLLCILFIRFTGMRADECLSLQVNNISIQEDGIRMIVRGKGDKERPLYLDLAFLEYLEKMFKLREKYKITSKYFFATQNNKKTTIQNLYKANKALLKEAGIKDERKQGLHTYRHTLASQLVNEDINLETIREILGHSDISITSRYYAKTNENAKKRSLLKIQKRR